MSNSTMQPEVFEHLGTIALVGGGKMGEAIISGLVQGALLDPRQLIVVEPNADRRELLSETYGVDCLEQGEELPPVETALFAVKPQVFIQVAKDLAAAESFAPKRVISIAAGITTTTIRALFPEAQVIRVMPNTPLMVSTGMSVVAVSEHTQLSEGELVVQLFSLMGDAVLVDEDKIDAVTAISGSGPAYFALLAEELALAGEGIGLSAELSERLAVQTLIGTARQLQLTEESPLQLREAVTSPGGTTEAALNSFKTHHLDSIVKQAVKAAYLRAQELS